MNEKREMTSFEYSILLKELQNLIGKKINKLYELENGIFRVKINKEDLMIELGKRINLTKYIENAPKRPTNFTMFLRKRLKNAIITKIYQHNTDRVFVIECEKENEIYKIVLEMFSKGNMIILDKDNKIISPYHREDWKDRTIRRNKEYIFPQNKVYSLIPEIKELEELLDERYVIVCFSKLPIGTLYIKEILKMCEINEKEKGNALDKKEKEDISKNIKKIVENAKPYGFVKEEKVIDFSLIKKENYILFESFNKVLDEYYHIETEEIIEESKSMKKLKKRLESQKEHLKILKKQEKEFKENGDLIYEKYTNLEKLLNWVRKKIEEKKWEEIEKELEKINAKINKKTKVITIKL